MHMHGLYMSMVHVASGVHHCTAEYIYRAGGGFATPYQLANLPPLPSAHLGPGGPRRRSPRPSKKAPPPPLIVPPLPPRPPRAPNHAPGPPLPASEPPAGWCPRLARAPRFARPLSSTAHRSGRRTGQLPRRANWRPTPPSASRALPGARSTAGRPLAPGTGGLGTACGACRRGRRGCRGVLLRGPSCQGPHRKIPRAAPTLTQPNAATVTHPQSLRPGPLVGPRSLLHRLTDPIWGVKMQYTVKVARNCCGGQFLYGVARARQKHHTKWATFSKS